MIETTLGKIFARWSTSGCLCSRMQWDYDPSKLQVSSMHFQPSGFRMWRSLKLPPPSHFATTVFPSNDWSAKAVVKSERFNLLADALKSHLFIKFATMGLLKT